MATRLTKPMTRIVEYDKTLYRVVVSEQGIFCAIKGKQRGRSFTWKQLLAQPEEAPSREPSDAAESKSQLGMSPVVAADVILLLRRVDEITADAAKLIANASTLPAAIAENREPRRPTDEEQSDWFIEPLFTRRELADMLNMSTRSVQSLGIPEISLNGQIRYHPADVRRVIASKREESERQRRASLSRFERIRDDARRAARGG